MLSTKEIQYTQNLINKQYVWWKKLLDVQRPYRWNLRRLKLGYVLDVGCGIGRNLLHINGNGVGVDHNSYSVDVAKSIGLNAFTDDAFKASEFNQIESFDSLLLSHVAEHMTESEVIELLKFYLPLLKSKGKLVIITPQEKGYNSDPTHIQFMNFETLQRITEKLNLNFIKKYSFPFPRIIGLFFKYNEFVFVAEK
jgi:SAM-dependent methyltransferase